MDPIISQSVYQSPLVTRNASPEMLAVFSPQRKFSTWRRIWLALAQAQKELGLPITDEQIAQMSEHIEDIDFEEAARQEERLRHDVMAHLHTFAKAAPAAKPIIHLGATSMDIVDNTDVLLLRDGLDIIARKLGVLIDRLGKFAQRYRDLAVLSYTHLQPAQPSTLGKRAVLWCYDFVLALADIELRRQTLMLRGIKGTTGTQASFLELFAGDHEKVRRLEHLVAQKLGFQRVHPVSGQTYSRIIDVQIICSLAAIGAAAHKMALDIRLLAAFKEIDEPFEDEQVGSSAMAYKRNPVLCERVTGLARWLMGMTQQPLFTAAQQMFERTLDDSSNKRLSIPEAFLTTDAILDILIYVSGALSVNEKVIEQRLRDELPFMSTENLLMAAVKAGGDRQELHERIRRHSLAAARQVKEHGLPNDLIDRLKADSAFAGVDLNDVMDPKQYIGRSVEQVDEFIAQTIEPIRARYQGRLNHAFAPKV
ncbi:MAG TPA: adenylosuccinate lyase [Phycisphaerae bacterium]|nr:adenylosuccinate lyase [Phycisphaerae bacterium]